MNSINNDSIQFIAENLILPIVVHIVFPIVATVGGAFILLFSLEKLKQSINESKKTREELRKKLEAVRDCVIDFQNDSMGIRRISHRGSVEDIQKSLEAIEKKLENVKKFYENKSYWEDLKWFEKHYRSLLAKWEYVKNRWHNIYYGDIRYDISMVALQGVIADFDGELQYAMKNVDKIN